MLIKSIIIFLSTLSLLHYASLLHSIFKNDNAYNTTTQITSNYQPKPKLTLLFYGDSITAGFGIDPDSAYPALIQQKADSLNIPIRVINAGLSGETSAGGVRRLSWILRQPVDVFVIALGGNDLLRGIDIKNTTQNLSHIVEDIQKKSPHTTIVLAGIKPPTHYGIEYSQDFEQLYIDIAKNYNIPLIPFILKDVGGIRKLNLPDNIHPNTRGHSIISQNMWMILEPLIKEKLKTP